VIQITMAGRHVPIDVVFFDCDGVIFDTNADKADAFDHAVADCPADKRAALVALHKATGGISRYAKLRRFFTEMHPVVDAETAIERALARFGAHSRASYRRLQPRSEALRFAEAAGPSYVVSGADQTELQDVFAEHGIADRFIEVLGSPVDKPTHLRRVLAERGVEPARSLFIGDGGGDLECAETIGCWFVFLAEMSDWCDGSTAVDAARPGLLARGTDATSARTWADLHAMLVADAVNEGMA
jgi:phosphoglycolate phosphatase-like HAD superfamily hydrolase